VLPFATQLAKCLLDLSLVLLGFSRIPHVEVNFAGQLGNGFFEPFDF
jgi:hypothetical protein